MKYFLTDFGEKFANKTFEKFTIKEDVKEEPSITYTQEQNKKAKRLNYILMSSVRSILAAIHLPITLWDELIQTG